MEKRRMKWEKERDKYSLGRSNLFPEWYKYIEFTEEIKNEFRSVVNEPSGKEYLKGNKEDYQEIRYKVYDLDIVQYINLKTGHHVYECEGHFFWEVYDNIHKSIEDFPIYSLELRMAMWDIWKPLKIINKHDRIWRAERETLHRQILNLLTYKYKILRPIGNPPLY